MQGRPFPIARRHGSVTDAAMTVAVGRSSTRRRRETEGALSRANKVPSPETGRGRGRGGEESVRRRRGRRPELGDAGPASVAYGQSVNPSCGGKRSVRPVRVRRPEPRPVRKPGLGRVSACKVNPPTRLYRVHGTVTCGAAMARGQEVAWRSSGARARRVDLRCPPRITFPKTLFEQQVANTTTLPP